ncbi:MAG: nucleotidyltransferase domain-containing protein [Patescibacteria group bacterium]
MNANIGNKINVIADKIVRTVRPEKIILFGSRAWGTPNADSDIDLFVIKKTNRSTRDVAREIDASIWGSGMPVDVIVYTPENVEKRLAMKDFFVSDVMQKGKVLYSA